MLYPDIPFLQEIHSTSPKPSESVYLLGLIKCSNDIVISASSFLLPFCLSFKNANCKRERERERERGEWKEKDIYFLTVKGVIETKLNEKRRPEMVGGETVGNRKQVLYIHVCVYKYAKD